MAQSDDEAERKADAISPWEWYRAIGSPQRVLAPMVDQSEPAFRLLCRKYGAQTAYTPMMNSHKFANDPNYREEEFQTVPEDRPLVCHFSSNDPKDFVAAAKLVQDRCDAIDLNLGCPQRTAYLGHFGSYLLEPKDRHLICSIVREAAEQITVPIFVKIRLQRSSIVRNREYISRYNFLLLFM